MNKELEKQDLLTKVKMTMLYAAKTGMYEKEAQEIIALCADEAIEAANDRKHNQPHNDRAEQQDYGMFLATKAIEKRLK